jgi:hypothetical protein
MTFMLYPPKRTETNTIWVRNNLPPWSCRSTLCKARLIFSPSVDEYCMISEIQTSLLQELRGRVILSNFFLLFTVPFCIVCSFILLGIYATRFCAISTVTRPEEEFAGTSQIQWSNSEFPTRSATLCYRVHVMAGVTGDLLPMVTCHHSPALNGRENDELIGEISAYAFRSFHSCRPI